MGAVGFTSSRNIASKVPRTDDTVRFYRGSLGLKLPGANLLKAAGVIRQDEIEPLPEGYDSFWIAILAAIIYMVAKSGRYQMWRANSSSCVVADFGFGQHVTTLSCVCT